MSKTLVIKGANFAANKVAAIDITDPVYCTGISLNKASASFSSIGATETLTATVTPADTTEPVSWSSSNTSVATVANGVVTAIGLGSATITATCGNFTATCAVTVRAFITSVKLYPDAYISGSTSYSGGNGVLEFASTGNSRCILAAETGAYSIKNKFHDAYYYPIPLPGGAARLKITRADTVVKIVNINFCSLSTPATGTSYTQLVDKIQESGISYTDNVAIVSIPQHEGYAAIDSVVITLQTTDSSEFLEAYLDKITIEALPAA